MSSSVAHTESYFQGVEHAEKLSRGNNVPPVPHKASNLSSLHDLRAVEGLMIFCARFSLYTSPVRKSPSLPRNIIDMPPSLPNTLPGAKRVT